jgi:hypothetical protein
MSKKKNELSSLNLSSFMHLKSFLAGYISETMKLGPSLPAYRTYALEELKEATKNFEASSLIGATSIGQVQILDN